MLSSLRRDHIILSLFGLIAASSVAAAQTPQPNGDVYVVSRDGQGRFALASAGKSASLFVSPEDFPGVSLAARSLRVDIGKVTRAEPSLVTQIPTSSHDLVIIGTLGKNALIDRLVREKKLDVTGIAGKWEAFLTQVVDAPAPGIDRALVIAGSDKRGTIYGIYDLSSQIGVSPWYWWADVPVRQQSSLFVLPGRHTLGEPAVKYRGIFFNDEAPGMSGWAKEKFGGINHQMYEKAFELILRLKGNYLWPAMWGNAFNDDDKVDPALADEYGVVMGTSHHEPMDRAQQEWKRYGKGPWNYATNDSVLGDFWTQGIKNMGSHETIVTVGMRGDGDAPMVVGGDLDANIKLLERIVKDQRSIITKVTGKDPSATPQDWALYKEVQDYYDKGMRVPDDVTLLFSDDNWGNIRRLPQGKDTLRAGGFGIYYHFDYVGGPRNYKWLNTNPISRTWEQMHLAYEYGARQIWIVNVGDLKPMEFPISFFLDYAWNPNKWPADKLPEYTRQWAAQQFGPAHAAEIADLITTDLKFAARRKPELVDTATYSLTNFDEAERVVAAYDTLRSKAERLAKVLPPSDHDAYYQLVQHPIEALANLNHLYVDVAKNRLYAVQGRASTNDLADQARKLFEHDAEITAYYNTQVAGGKWDHMMDQTHIGYTYWQEPPRNTMPRVDVIQLPKAADMGVAIVEQNRPAPAGRGGRGAGGPPPAAFFGRGAFEPTLPAFNPNERQTYHVDVYNKGQTSFAFTAKAAEPWVVISPASGTVGTEQRVSVSIDWTHAPAGDHKVPITFTGPSGAPSVIQAVVSNPSSPARESVVGFVEGGGYVSMEAEHYTRALGSSGGSGPAVVWQRIPDLGRTLSGMMTSPVTAPSRLPTADAAHLEYSAFFFDSGAVKVSVFVSPTLNFSASKDGLRYAVSFDDQPPQIVNVQSDTTTRTWEKLVAENIIITTTAHTLAHAGEHVLKFWRVDPGVVLQKIVIESRDLPQSYLGPPESFHGGAATERSASDKGASHSAHPR